MSSFCSSLVKENKFSNLIINYFLRFTWKFFLQKLLLTFNVSILIEIKKMLHDST